MQLSEYTPWFSPTLLGGRYPYFQFNKGLKLRDIKSLAYRQVSRRGQSREAILVSTLSRLTLFLWMCLLIWTFHTDFGVSPRIGNGAHCLPENRLRRAAFPRDPVQPFNGHSLFEHLECAMNSLSNPDSFPIQSSVSSRPVCFFPPAVKRLVTLWNI